VDVDCHCAIFVKRTLWKLWRLTTKLSCVATRRARCSFSCNGRDGLTRQLQRIVRRQRAELKCTDVRPAQFDLDDSIGCPYLKSEPIQSTFRHASCLPATSISDLAPMTG